MRDLSAFKTAIRTQALKRSASGTTIIAADGSHAQWLFDFRAILLQAEWLDLFAELFWDRYADTVPFQVGGMETAGIPLVAAIVMKSKERGTPVNGFYIRKSRKKDGLLKYIEGTLTDEPVILVDDIINSGSTFVKQLLVLDDAGATVRDIFALLKFRPDTAYEFAAKRSIAITSVFSLAEFGLSVDESGIAPVRTYEPLWRNAAATPSRQIVTEKSAPAFYKGLVLYGTDSGVFCALDAATGNSAWEFSAKGSAGKGILSSPAVHDGAVFFGAYNGDVYALEARTGALRWTYTDADWIGSSPAIDAQRNCLYIGAEYGLFKRKGGIIALDCATGREIWRDSTPEFTHGSPLFIAAENMIVIGSNNGVVYAYDADTHRRLWTHATRGHIKGAPAYDPATRMIAVNAMDGRCYILSHRGEPLFAAEADAGFYSSPLIRDGILFTASLDKRVYAYDLKTFAQLWVFETGGRVFSTPALFRGSLWSGSNDGTLYEIDPRTGKKRGALQLSERVVNAPAYDDETGTVFVGTQANEMYAFRV